MLQKLSHSAARSHLQCKSDHISCPDPAFVCADLKTYNIEIAAGLLDQIGAKARVLSQAVKAAIISDSNVDPLYGERLERSLAASGFEVTRIVFAAGEQSKNLTVLGQVYDELARAGLTRSDLILTLGGGVPGDLGGFAADRKSVV